MKIGSKFTSVRLIKTKGGKIFPTGTEFTFNSICDDSRHGKFGADSGSVNISFDIAHKIFNSFSKPPNEKSMEKWMNSGIAMSIGGHRVEPDGYDPDGMPSWLIALGLI